MVGTGGGYTNVSEATYTKPVGLEVAEHVAIATEEVQEPAIGTAALRTAPVAAAGAPNAQQTTRAVQEPSGMQF